MKTLPVPPPASVRLWTLSTGLALAVLTILFGRVIRIAFGLNKNRLQRRA